MDDVIKLISSLTEVVDTLTKTVEDIEKSVATFEGEMEQISIQMMDVCQLQGQLDSIIRYIAKSDNVAEFEVSG